jgi:hypothetical protein
MNPDRTSVETIITIKLPMERIPAPKRDQFYAMLPRRCRWFGWLFGWGGGSIQEFGGERINTVRHLELFRCHILTIHRNQYHNQSDKERADRYIKKWSACEKELRGLRLLLMGDSVNAEVKKVIRDSFGIDLDEGTSL